MDVVVRRCIDILIIINYYFPYPTCISFFWQQHPYFVHFENVFSLLFMLYLCNIANVAQRTFEIVQKSRSRERGVIINYIDKNVGHKSSARTRARESRDFNVRGAV